MPGESEIVAQLPMNNALQTPPTPIFSEGLIVPRRLNVDPDPAMLPRIAQILKWGFLVLPGALPPDTLRSLRDAVDEVSDRYRHQEPTRDSRQGLYHFMLEEDERFHLLLDYPPVFRWIQAIMGTCVQLHSATGRFVLPGMADQAWHRDSPWPVDPEGVPIGSLPSQINAIYYLDDVDETNGPTVLVPGSHLSPFLPPEGQVRFPDEVRVLGKAGTCAIVNNYLFHRGSANTSSRPRRSLLFCYQNAWLKSRDTFEGPRCSALRANGNATRKLLLGGIEVW